MKRNVCLVIDTLYNRSYFWSQSLIRLMLIAIALWRFVRRNRFPLSWWGFDKKLIMALNIQKVDSLSNIGPNFLPVFSLGTIGSFRAKIDMAFLSLAHLRRWVTLTIVSTSNCFMSYHKMVYSVPWDSWHLLLFFTLYLLIHMCSMLEWHQV